MNSFEADHNLLSASSLLKFPQCDKYVYVRGGMVGMAEGVGRDRSLESETQSRSLNYLSHHFFLSDSALAGN